MREHFQSLGKEGMKMELRVLETGTLITMCDDIAVIENENYEICKAINKVLEERKDLI